MVDMMIRSDNENARRTGAIDLTHERVPISAAPYVLVNALQKTFQESVRAWNKTRRLDWPN